MFEGNSTFAVLGKHAHVEPPRPSERANGVPAKLEAVILRCLETTPERRHADARELARALAECDDVEPWTQAHARAWWQERRSSAGPESLAPRDHVLTVDVHARAAGAPARLRELG